MITRSARAAKLSLSRSPREPRGRSIWRSPGAQPGLHVEHPLAAPDRTRWTGRRDHALLTFDLQTGLRVSELAGSRCADLALGRGPYVRVTGKGRKERVAPLTGHTVALLRAWLGERGGAPTDPVFPGPAGRPLGRDAVRKLVVKYAHAAAGSPSLAAKTRGRSHPAAHRRFACVESTEGCDGA